MAKVSDWYDLLVTRNQPVAVSDEFIRFVAKNEYLDTDKQAAYARFLRARWADGEMVSPLQGHLALCEFRAATYNEDNHGD